MSALLDREMDGGEFVAFIDSECMIGSEHFEDTLPVLRFLVDATGSEYAVEDLCDWIKKT